MRIFNVNRRMTVNGEILESVGCNLTVADVRVIVSALEKYKTDDVLFASCKTELLSNLKKLI